MPRFDPEIEVLCDGCGLQEFWEPAFVYRSQVDRVGHYDTSDKAFADWCKHNLWSQGEANETYCEQCSDERKES